MLENLAKGREKRKQFIRREKKKKELENLQKEKEELKKEKKNLINWKTNFELKEVKKPKKKYTCKPKEELQVISESDDSSSSED